jgi:large subunit ribosomal protein L18
MARGSTYKVKFRRRREGRTDYYRRRRLLLSGKPRLVVRKTNTRTIAQFIIAKRSGDRTIAAAVSSELYAYGWDMGMGNMPAAYLTGLLAAKRAEEKGIEEAVLDIGLNPPVAGSSVFAVLKGALDGGIDVPHNPEVLPDDSRIQGEHIAAAYEHFNESDEENHMFDRLERMGVDVSKAPEQFEKAKETIIESSVEELEQMKEKAKDRRPIQKKHEPKEREEPEEHPPRAKPIKHRRRLVQSHDKKRKK